MQCTTKKFCEKYWIHCNICNFLFSKTVWKARKKSGFKVVILICETLPFFILFIIHYHFAPLIFHACSTCCHLCFFPEEHVHGVTVMSLNTFPNTMSRNICNLVCLSSVVQSSFKFMQLLSSFFVIKKTDLKH